jgi:hypothetical protein
MKQPFSIRKLANAQHGVYRGSPTGILFRGSEPECRNWIAAEVRKYRRLNRERVSRSAHSQQRIDHTLASVPGSARVWSKLSATGRDWFNSIRACERRAAAFERAGMRSQSEKYSEHCGSTANAMHEQVTDARSAYDRLVAIKHVIATAAQNGEVNQLRSAMREGEALLQRYDVDGYGCLIDLG